MKTQLQALSYQIATLQLRFMTLKRAAAGTDAVRTYKVKATRVRAHTRRSFTVIRIRK